jgi:hypothetical protein
MFDEFGTNHARIRSVAETPTLAHNEPMTVSVAPALPLFQLKGVGSVLSRLSNLFVREPAASDDEEQYHLVRFAEKKFGEPVLLAASKDDFEEILDHMIANEQFLALCAALLDDLDTATIDRLISGSTPTSVPIIDFLKERLPIESLSAVELGERYALGILWAVKELYKYTPIGDLKAAMQGMAAMDVSMLWRDPNTPPVLARILVSALQGMVCLMALSRAASTKQKPDPWLVLALLEKWKDGAHDYLVFLACCLPGIDVPLDLIPLEERIDFESAAERTFAALLRDDELLEQARESDARVYPVPEKE